MGLETSSLEGCSHPEGGGELAPHGWAASKSLMKHDGAKETGFIS